MAKTYTGIDGSLLLDGTKVAKVSEWSLSAQADTLETTSLGDFAKTYVYGVQSFSGSAKIFYYETDAGQIAGAGLLGDVLRTTATPSELTHTIELNFTGGAATRKLSFSAKLNSVEIGASAGEVIEATVGFTVTGPLTTMALS